MSNLEEWFTEKTKKKTRNKFGNYTKEYVEWLERQVQAFMR